MPSPRVHHLHTRLELPLDRESVFAFFAEAANLGPYTRWVHRHRFIETPTGTRIEDDVAYELPFGVLGQLAVPLVRRQLDRIFAHRAARVRELLTPGTEA